MKTLSRAGAVAALALSLLLPQLALAHAVLVSSSPEAHATVKGPEVAVHLKFNSRVDGVRSRIFLRLPNQQTNSLQIEKQDAPDTLKAHTTLKPGSYTILWQALSPDGHTTRGEIPFSVQ